MALDTREKRQTVKGVGRPWLRGPFPIATPDVEWRAAVGNTYGANGFEAPEAPATAGNAFIAPIMHHYTKNIGSR